MMEMPNVVGFLRTALADKDMRYRARQSLFFALEGGLLGEQTRSVEKGLRLSDAGSCSLELWYKLRDQLDLPIDPIDMQLTRFDYGTLTGAWVGALVAEGARADGWHAILEEEVTLLGIPGHIDVRLWKPAEYDLEGPPLTFLEARSHVVEIKTKNDTGKIKNPEKEAFFQLIQAGAYCHPDDAALASQSFTLLVVQPSATKGIRCNQFHFRAAPYEKIAKSDYARMSAALDYTPPVGDPPDKWRCFTCLASRCKKNKNKAANSPELLA